MSPSPAPNIIVRATPERLTVEVRERHPWWRILAVGGLAVGMGAAGVDFVATSLTTAIMLCGGGLMVLVKGWQDATWETTLDLFEDGHADVRQSAFLLSRRTRCSLSALREARVGEIEVEGEIRHELVFPEIPKLRFPVHDRAQLAWIKEQVEGWLRAWDARKRDPP